MGEKKEEQQNWEFVIKNTCKLSDILFLSQLSRCFNLKDIVHPSIMKGNRLWGREAQKKHVIELSSSESDSNDITRVVICTSGLSYSHIIQTSVIMITLDVICSLHTYSKALTSKQQQCVLSCQVWMWDFRVCVEINNWNVKIWLQMSWNDARGIRYTFML